MNTIQNNNHIDVFKNALMLVCLLLLTACASTGPTAQHRISISETGDTLEVTVPLSDLVMSLSKGGLRHVKNNQGGATASPRYFYLEDRSSGITTLSGWFEPADRQIDLHASWNVEMESLRKKGIGPPQDIEFGSVGPMRAILYARPHPGYSSSFHVRASYVGAGTWVNLHASASLNASPAVTRDRVLALVRSLKFFAVVRSCNFPEQRLNLSD